MDERPPGAAVSVSQRVDGFELRVGDRRLNERRMVVAVDICEEVAEQCVEGFRWGRDKRCATRVVAAAANPILPSADHPGDPWRSRSLLGVSDRAARPCP